MADGRMWGRRRFPPPPPKNMSCVRSDDGSDASERDAAVLADAARHAYAPSAQDQAACEGVRRAARDGVVAALAERNWAPEGAAALESRLQKLVQVGERGNGVAGGFGWVWWGAVGRWHRATPPPARPKPCAPPSCFLTPPSYPSQSLTPTPSQNATAAAAVATVDAALRRVSAGRAAGAAQLGAVAYGSFLSGLGSPGGDVDVAVDAELSKSATKNILLALARDLRGRGLLAAPPSACSGPGCPSSSCASRGATPTLTYLSAAAPPPSSRPPLAAWRAATRRRPPSCGLSRPGPAPRAWVRGRMVVSTRSPSPCWPCFTCRREWAIQGGGCGGFGGRVAAWARAVPTAPNTHHRPPRPSYPNPWSFH